MRVSAFVVDIEFPALDWTTTEAKGEQFYEIALREQFMHPEFKDPPSSGSRD